ncbi:MAG: hypothetical protein HY329_22840 [Chloroflexi bacterium]|nr:hypothetical protein [Chloroflexota bacterium]
MEPTRPTQAGPIAVGAEVSSPTAEPELSAEWAPVQSPQEFYQKLIKSSICSAREIALYLGTDRAYQH